MRRRNFLISTFGMSLFSANPGIEDKEVKFKNMLNSETSNLEIGSQKQLFIDNYLIDKTNHIEKILHRPVRHSSNPILIGDRPWEKWTAYVNGRGVAFDEETREFKMWYLTPLMNDQATGGIKYKVCYATSKNGISWIKPKLDLVEWSGNRDNNIIPSGEKWMRRPNVIWDPYDSNPDRRFKMTYADVINDKKVTAKALSKDGIHWHLNVDNNPIYPRHHANLLGWDARIQQYVIYGRMPPNHLGIGRATSPDFLSWTDYEEILTPPNELYIYKGIAAFFYENLYLGFLWVFNNELREFGAELVVSRDGVSWQRPFPDQFFFKKGEKGTWDSSSILPVAPVILNDKIWIYYGGWNTPYDVGALRQIQNGWIKNDQRMQRAVGLATLPLDRFVSLHAGIQGGDILTKPIQWTGSELYLNVDASSGSVQVEILDNMYQPIKGFTREKSILIKTNKLRQKVKWKTNRPLTELQNNVIRFRIYLKNADLYALYTQDNI